MLADILWYSLSYYKTDLISDYLQINLFVIWI